MQLNYPYAINVDWLQVYCHDRNREPLNMLYNSKNVYEFNLQPHGSRHFKEIWEVLNEDGDKYATIQRIPHSRIISEDAAIVQLANRELYRSHYAANFLLFLTSHGFEYKSISRLDVCFDSNYLRNGLKHSNLIKSIMEGKILKNNQAKVQWNFSAVATIGRPMECNSCSFGSKSSGVSSKMYNKTLEMKEQTLKPYIEENWVFNGINVEQDVWRIELSIKSDASTTIRTTTGEIFRLSADHLKLQDMVEDIFFSYASRYFSFKQNNGTKNKSRMPDVELFPKNRTRTLHPIRITGEKDSNRSDRIFLKKLRSLFDEFKNMDEQTWLALGEVVNAFTLSRGLSDWSAKMFMNDVFKESFEVAKRKRMLLNIEYIVQMLLNEHPSAVTEIGDFAILLQKILTK